MANSTDKSILTAAGKALLAQLNAEEKALVIDKMIFANVPNRPEYPQPDDVVPTDHIVHQEQVEQRGRLSADSVIYSTTLTSDVGPFDFNWTGAYCSEYGVLVTIDHHALTPKTADEPGVAGNTLVRSVVLEYKDIAEITNITVDASSWQYNATERMKKMDSDVAQSIIDQNGKDWFIEDGFLVTPSGSAYSIKAGAGYVSGNRVAMEFDRSVQVPNKPSFIYIDAHREGTPTGEQVTLFNFVVTSEEKDDYIDSSTGKDVKHFVCKIAQVHADGSVSDLRPEGESASRTFVYNQQAVLKGYSIVKPFLSNERIDAGAVARGEARIFKECLYGVRNNESFVCGKKPDLNFEKLGISTEQTLINPNVGDYIHEEIVYIQIEGTKYPLSNAISGVIKSVNIIAYPYEIKTDTSSALLLKYSEFKLSDIKNKTINLKAFWASGKKGEDQTIFHNTAYKFGVEHYDDKSFIMYYPRGVYDLTEFNEDRYSGVGAVKFLGEGIPNDTFASIIRFTDDAKNIASKLRGGKRFENLTIEFTGSRARATLANPMYTFEFAVEDDLSGVADIDVEFVNCIADDFHRFAKCVGRGFKWRGGAVINGGGGASEGCLLDIDMPNPFVPGVYPSQSKSNAMRAYFVSPDRVHACTGHLVRNKGYMANYLAQLRIEPKIIDTRMGLIRGAFVNTKVTSPQVLHNDSILIWVEDGFDCRKSTISDIHAIGAPESSIGETLSNGQVITEDDIKYYSVGTLLFVSPNAGVVKSIGIVGGEISDSFGDLIFFGKAINGFTMTNVQMENMLKDNKKPSGQLRHIVNFNGTESKNITIKNNGIENLEMERSGCLIGNAGNIRDYEVENNGLSGSIYESFDLHQNVGFGGANASVMCGTFTGDGLSKDRYVDKYRYPKAVVINEMNGKSVGTTYSAIAGEYDGDVLVENNKLITKGDAAKLNVKYSFMLFF